MFKYGVFGSFPAYGSDLHENFTWRSWLAAVFFLGLRRISTTLHKHSSYLQVPFYLKLVVELM